MTSGTFHTIDINSIVINRDERQRRKIDEIDELADSISRLGLIHPPVITRENVLVAGERRIAAVRHLGWTSIPIQYTDELDLGELSAIELEENIKRKNITFHEECPMIVRYHANRKEKDPNWSQEDTAKALGYERPTIVKKLSVGKELLAGNEEIASVKEFSTAVGILERKSSRAKEAELEELHTLALPEEKRTLPIIAAQSIINTSFLDWAPTYSGPRFNLIHCDFPYGIGADKFVQGAADAHGGYDDSEETYFTLLNSLRDNLDRIAADSCHIVFWFSLHYYTDTIDFFRDDTNFVVDPFPLVWLKSDNVGIIPDPERGPRRIYETALFGSRGDRKILRAKSNAYAAPTVRNTHMSEKPEPVLRHFFEMFVDENTVMLDPTCGSGSALRAAESLRAKSVLGLEINPEFADRAKLELAKSRRLRSVA